LCLWVCEEEAQETTNVKEKIRRRYLADLSRFFITVPIYTFDQSPIGKLQKSIVYPSILFS
jgi:hypothetical protein